MSNQTDEPRRSTDADEEVLGAQPAVGQKGTDETELSDQDLENVAGGARGVAIGKGIRSSNTYSGDVEIE